MPRKLKLNFKKEYVSVSCFLLLNIYALSKCPYNYTSISAFAFFLLPTGLYLIILVINFYPYFNYIRGLLLMIWLYEAFYLTFITTPNPSYTSIFFRNINLIACLTVCVYLLYFKRISAYSNSLIFILFFILTAVFLIYLKSRAAILSFTICNALFFLTKNSNFKFTKLRKLSYIIMMLLLFGGIVFLFRKQASAHGRLFIYKVVFSNMNNTFFGNGVNSFNEVYPIYLKEYFGATGINNLIDLQNAVIPEYAFNEFLQIFVELGFIGLLLFCITLIPVLNFIKQICDARYLCILALLINSLFSYTFHNPILYFLFVVLLALIHKEQLPLNYASHLIRRISFHLSIGLITIGSLFGLCYYHFHNMKMELTHTNYSSCMELKEANYYLSKVYRRDNNFINKLAKHLIYNCADTTFSLRLLERAKKEIPQYENILLLGEIYLDKNLIDSAELNFKEALRYLPNRFVPLHYLLYISLKRGDTLTAKRYAKRILFLPVKVPSLDITIAKWNAEKLLGIDK